MRFIVVPNIFYEVVVEYSKERVISRFFTLASTIKSREAAIAYFFEMLLESDVSTEEVSVLLFLRYLPTGERIEMISAATYDQSEDNFKPLTKEVRLYQKENIAVHLGLYDPKEPDTIRAIWPLFRNAYSMVGGMKQVLLLSDYWVFIKPKKVVYFDN